MTVQPRSSVPPLDGQSAGGTAVLPEVEIDESVLEDLDHEWDIICEISRLREQHSAVGYPPCRGDKAEWIAWRPKCCSQTPQYRLVCDHCRKVYIAWMARQAYVVCPVCEAESGFVEFTPLGKS